MAKITKRLKHDIDLAVKQSFQSGKIQDDQVTQFIKLFSKLPLDQAVTSLEMYKKSLKREMDKTTLVVESVIPLTSEQLTMIKKEVAKEYTVVAVEERIDPTLIGGCRVRIGDVVFDDSVETKIQEVKQAIMGV